MITKRESGKMLFLFSAPGFLFGQRRCGQRLGVLLQLEPENRTARELLGIVFHYAFDAVFRAVLNENIFYYGKTQSRAAGGL